MIRVKVDRAEATVIRRAITVALRVPVWDEGQVETITEFEQALEAALDGRVTGG
jgi:hypothetical protein